MEHLRLHGICLRGTEELSEEEKSLLNVISNSSLNMLRLLYLDSSMEWFKNSEFKDTLLDFIKNQTRLQVLNMNDCFLSCDLTESLLATLAESESVNTIKKVWLWRSACFDHDGAINQLAAFVEKA